MFAELQSDSRRARDYGEMQTGATRLPGSLCASYVSAFGRDISLRSPLLVRSATEIERLVLWPQSRVAKRMSQCQAENVIFEFS